MQIDHHLHQSLQKDVMRHFGKSIKTATDCERLAEKLGRNLKKSVSAQTLRRFFGIISSKGGANRYTLDTLSQYCGYKNFDTFTETQTEEELHHFFGGNEDPAKNYWNRAEELCEKLADSPELLVRAHYRLMEYPLARTYFMELHPMRDMLCTVYAQYFAAYLRYKDTNEAKLFAYAFLFLGAFLSGNSEFIQIYFQKILETPCTKEVFLIPAANKYGIMLLYADLTHNEKLYRQTWKEMLVKRVEYKTQCEGSVVSFEYTVLEFLIFTNRTKDMEFLMSHNTEQIYSDNGFVPQRRKDCHDTVWKILCAVALTKAGNTEKAKEKVGKTDVDKLGCGWSQYYSIIYYQTKKELGLPTDFNFSAVYSTTYLHKLPELIFP